MAQIQREGSDTQTFFDRHQRATIAAAMARIIPTDEQPGAAEAGTIDFLDRYLSGLGYIFAKPDGSGFETLTGKQAQAWQQRLDIIRARYVAGVEELDERSQTLFERSFVELDADRQDQVLREVEHPDGAPQFALEPALQQTNAEIELDFFGLLCLHTRQGFYADPIYGGNRNRVGWEVIGFPGPTSLEEVHSGRYTALPWFAEGHNIPLEETQDGN